VKAHHQTSDANSGRHRAQLERASRTCARLPRRFVLQLLENQADYIVDWMKGVRNTALEALALVILVLFLFLGSPRQVLIIGSRCVRVAGEFLRHAARGLFDCTSSPLGGLVGAIGVLPDASIILVENITRRRSRGGRRRAAW
jgi:multidrug efflux pump subunit AcrB